MFTPIVIGNGVFSADFVVSADTFNFNVKTAAIAAGWNQVSPVNLTVTVNAGVYIGGSHTSSASAFETGTGFPTGSTLKLINNGFIIGFGGNGGGSSNYNTYAGGGGAGGNALTASHPITIVNNGVIGGGGGGGGGGQGGNVHAGSGGGGGQGFDIGYAGDSTGGGTGPGPASSNGSKTSPGSAGVTSPPVYDPEQGMYTTYGATGGNGGSLGQSGGSSNSWGWSGQVTGGGAPGLCVTGNANITWTNTGTRYGTIE